MKVSLRKFSITSSLVLGLMAALPAQALDTLVQFSSDGTGDGTTDGSTDPGYDMIGIRTFDWQDTGNLVIEDTLVNSSTGATTLEEFFTSPLAVGDTLSFTIHAQTRLNDMTDSVNGSVLDSGRPTLDTDGSGSVSNGDYEITAALDAVDQLQ